MQERFLATFYFTQRHGGTEMRYCGGHGVTALPFLISALCVLNSGLPFYRKNDAIAPVIVLMIPRSGSVIDRRGLPSASSSRHCDKPPTN